MGVPAKYLTAFLGLMLGGCGLLGAQTRAASPDTAKASATEPYPEQGYLSPTSYLNGYFDFDFELPRDIHLAPMPEAASRDGSLQLLHLVGPAPADPEVIISAVPIATGKDQDAKALLRFDLDQELFRGVEELRGLSKANLAGHQFFLFETRRGIEQHVMLATTLDGYILQVVLAAHDEKVVHKLEASFRQIEFFPSADLRQHMATGAQAYDGPATSTHRMAALEGDPPANHIDPGRIRGDFYENAALGFSYRIPQGWTLEAEGAVQPAVERDRTRQNFGQPRISRNERRLMDLCSKTLFSAWAKRPGADGQIPYDEFGEVTVSAVSLACFAGMKFPETSNDSQQFKDFLMQFGLTHPILSDMRDAKAFSAGSNVFLFLHGTVGFQIPDDALSRRLSIAMAITQQRGYLLTWFFAAPHDSELQALTNERVSFDSPAAVTVANASKPSGGTTTNVPAVTSSAVPSTAAPADVAASSRANKDTNAASAAGASANAASNADATQPASEAADQPADAPATPPANRPTLLRPGETIQSQQGKGAPIAKQKQSE